jgi:hypothetical protein
MQMMAWNRVGMTLLAAGAAGFLLWLAAQFDRGTTGGYWAALGIVAGCGLLLGAAQLRGTGGNPPAMLLLAFLPVLVCAGWVLLYAQPHGNWFRSHVGRWSGDIGIRDVVSDVSTYIGVLAFGIGLVFAYVLEPMRVGRDVVLTGPRRRMTRRPIPTLDRKAADEPTAAEREEAATAADTRPDVPERTVVR